MFMTVTRSELQPGKEEEFKTMIEENLKPLLKESKGFREVFTVVQNNGREIMGIILWDSQEDFETYSKRPEVGKVLMEGAQRTLIGGYKREDYRVINEPTRL